MTLPEGHVYPKQQATHSPRIRSFHVAKKYMMHYQEFRRKTMVHLRHPNLPWVLALLIGFGMFCGLFQIWLRTKPVVTAHLISQEIQSYQNLIERKKRLVLELSQKRATWYSQAQEQLHMIYPTEFIAIEISPPHQDGTNKSNQESPLNKPPSSVLQGAPSP